MKQKHVLLFIDWYRPGYKAGGPIQSCANMVEQLQSNEIHFSIITRNTDYCESIPYSTVKSNAWNQRDDNSRVYYISDDQLNRRTLERLILETGADIIYINGIYSRWFSIEPLRIANKQARNQKLKIIVAARGMLAPSAMAIKLWKKHSFLKWARLTGLYKRTIFHATSLHEVDHIQKLLGQSTSVVFAGNLPERSVKNNKPKIKERGLVRMICIARIAPEKNIAYALKVLEKVQGRAEFDLYGPVYDHAYAQECHKIAEKLPSNIVVRFHEPVPPEKVTPLLEEAHILFLPTQGENFGHIILQSLIAGCPVVISDQTPWRNLEQQNAGADLPLNQPELFASAIERFSAMLSEEFSLHSRAAAKLGADYAKADELVKQNKAIFFSEDEQKITLPDHQA